MKKIAVVAHYGFAASKAKLAHLFDILVSYFGFIGWHEFLWSVAKPKLLLFLSPLIAFLATVATYAEVVIGIKANTALAFIVLNMAEWATGVWAARYEGKVFSSAKFSRAIIKTFVYIVMIGVLHQLKDIDAHSFAVGIFDWTYWAVLFGICIVLTRSVFENMHRMGIREASTIYRVLNNRYTRIITGEPEPEKSERK